jgi:hypothetical protein
VDDAPLEAGCLPLLEPLDAEPAAAGCLSGDFVLSGLDFSDLSGPESPSAPRLDPLRLSVR